MNDRESISAVLKRITNRCGGEMPLDYEVAISAICDMNKEILEDYCRSCAVGFRDLRTPLRKKVI